jgi:hypothetical protein
MATAKSVADLQGWLGVQGNGPADPCLIWTSLFATNQTNPLPRQQIRWVFLHLFEKTIDQSCNFERSRHSAAWA